MPKLETARKIILDYRFEPETINQLKELEEYRDCEYYDGQYTRQFTELTNEVLARSLGYGIKLIKKKTPQEAMAAGVSKFKGDPDLPKSWEWPGDLKFHCQLNIADFKQYDLEDEFPSSGILYFFDNEDGATEDFSVLYYDGPLAELEARKHESAFTTSYQLSFTPYCIFYLTDYNEILDFLPENLKEEMESILACRLTGDDANFRIFGRPVFWQMEDIPPADNAGGDLLKSLMLPGLVKSPPEEKDKPSRILLLQDDYGEGTVHFWISASDLKSRNFNATSITYSGT